jgi:hypothetical protein
MTFTFRLPAWLILLVARRKIAKLQARSALTGSASETTRHGPFEVTAWVGKEPTK